MYVPLTLPTYRMVMVKRITLRRTAQDSLKLKPTTSRQDCYYSDTRRERQYEMASNGRPSTFDNNHEPSDDRSAHHGSDVGRAVTDAVHERFRQNFVYCDNCKEKFIGNGVSIQKHFNKSHPADAYCIYCPGKVFHYYKVKNGNDEAEKIYYHRCRDWLTK